MTAFTHHGKFTVEVHLFDKYLEVIGAILGTGGDAAINKTNFLSLGELQFLGQL